MRGHRDERRRWILRHGAVCVDRWPCPDELHRQDCRGGHDVSQRNLNGIRYMWGVARRRWPGGIINRTRRAYDSDVRIASKDGRSALSLLSSCVRTAVRVTNAYVAVDKHTQNDNGVKRLTKLRSRPRYQRAVIGDALGNALVMHPVVLKRP